MACLSPVCGYRAGAFSLLSSSKHDRDLVPGEASVEECFEVVRVQGNGLAVFLYGSSKVALLAQAVPLGMVLISQTGPLRGQCWPLPAGPPRPLHNHTPLPK